MTSGHNSAIAIRGRGHKVRNGVIGAVILLIAALVLAVFGAYLAWDEYRFEVTSPGLGLPTWIYTVWLPILSLAICGRAAGAMIRAWRGKTG